MTDLIFMTLNASMDVIESQDYKNREDIDH